MSKRFEPTGVKDGYTPSELYKTYWRCDGCYNRAESEQLKAIMVMDKPMGAGEMMRTKPIFQKDLCVECLEKPVSYWIEKQQKKEKDDD